MVPARPCWQDDNQCLRDAFDMTIRNAPTHTASKSLKERLAEWSFYSKDGPLGTKTTTLLPLGPGGLGPGSCSTKGALRHEDDLAAIRNKCRFENEIR